MDTLFKNDKKTTPPKKRSKKGKIERLINKTLNLIPSQQNVHKQYTSSNALVRMGSFRGAFTGRWYKKAIRNAVYTQDLIRLKDFLAKGLDLHTVITDVYWDTPLTYAVKCGYLDIVELLLHIPGSNVDHKDRNNHSTLDEAIKSLLSTRSNESKRTIGNRYRIIKSLLCAGAKEITHGYIDTVLFSTVNTKSGQLLIQRLVKVVSEFGCIHVKSIILTLLIPYQGTSSYLKQLLNNGANPLYLIKQATATIPVKNAIGIVKYSSTDKQLLNCIQYNTSQDIRLISRNWANYQLLLRLLIQSRLQLRLIIIDYLYHNHPVFYKWMLSYESQPLPLLDICRLKVRRQMSWNMLQSVQKLPTIPDSVRSILLFE